MAFHDTKKRLKATPFWAFARWSSRRLVHSLPLPLCRILMRVPCIGLIASARVFAVESCAHFFAGAPGKQVDLVPGLNARDPQALQKGRGLLPFTPASPCSIAEHCHVLSGQGRVFTGQKVALLAHWDPDDRIDPFVLHYVSALRKAGYRTVLASAVQLAQQEADSSGADAVLYRSCDGYDFTSWKGALECFPSLRQAREILFTNDSVFAPLTDIGQVHSVMDAVDCDFWGLMESRDQLPAMPSFYMVFRNRALQHPCFEQFWGSVDSTSDKETVVRRFEHSQALWFALHGLVPGAYIHWDMLSDLKGGPAYVCWKQLVELFGVPCIKRTVVNGDVWWADNSGWEDLVLRSGYPMAFIKDFLKRYRKARL